MKDKIYKVVGDEVIINWKMLNESKILTNTELTILYTLIDKVEASKGNVLQLERV